MWSVHRLYVMQYRKSHHQRPERLEVKLADEKWPTEGRIRHLELIQSVINRLAANSFIAKGWALTVAGVIYSFAITHLNPWTASAGLLPTVGFWWLDGYYLLHERLFRCLYNEASQQASSVDLFSMDIRPYKQIRNTTWLRVLFSATMSVFYGVLVLIGIAFIVAGIIHHATSHAKPAAPASFGKEQRHLRGDNLMARRVFFSFKYEDVSRAMIVRNSWVIPGRDAAGFVDAADFEKIKRKGDNAVKSWIDDQLKGTSVTVVLVGSLTCSSRWVKYEIDMSKYLGHGLLGIDISKVKDWNGNTTDRCGKLPAGYPFYLWNNDNGYTNMGTWIEAAAKAAGR